MIAPGRLEDIQATGDPVTVSQHNFEVLTEEVYKFTPSFQNGVATTVIGPPTTGDHILDEQWKDAWLGTWRCTVAGTPGTWRQEAAAVRNGEPSTGTIPVDYQILDSAAHYQRKYHLGGYVWQSTGAVYTLSGLTGLTGGGTTNLDGIVTAGVAVGVIAEALVSGVRYVFRLRAGTDTELSPFIVRPDDYAGTTNEKVWELLERAQYPADCSRQLTGLTGSTAADLNAIPTVSLAVGALVQFLVAGSLVAYRLRAGTDATNSPTVIRPVDFQSVTNAKVWERVLIVGQPGDAMLGSNNLSEINTGTKRATARTNLDVLWSDDVVGRLEARTPRGGLFFGLSGTVDGAVGLAIGTGDFTISATVKISSEGGITPLQFATHSSGNNRVYVTAALNAVELHFVDGAGNDTDYSLAPDVAMSDGDVFQLTISVDRDGLASLYINGVGNRDFSGGGVTVSVAASSSVNIGSGNVTFFQATNLYGTIYGLRVLNYAVTEAEALVLAKTGRSYYGVQWGALPPTATYTSDFSAGADSFTATQGTAAGNIDSIGGENDTLRLTCNSSSSNHKLTRTTLTLGKAYRVRARVFIPSANATVKSVRLGSNVLLATVTTLDAWTQVDVVQTVVGDGTGLVFVAGTVAGVAAGSGCNGDLFYLKDVAVTRLGTALDLDFQHADPSQSLLVRDISSNATDGSASASGVEQVALVPQFNVSKRINLGQVLAIGLAVPDGGTPVHIAADAGGIVGNAAVKLTGAGTSSGIESKLTFQKSQGTLAAKTAITSGDTLSRIGSQGHDGTSFQNSAEIRAVSENTVATGSVPSRFTVFTTPIGGVQQERQFIGHMKSVANNTPTAIASCTVDNGTVAAGVLRYCVQVTDGTDVQVEEGTISYHVTNKAGAVANNTTVKFGNQQAMTAGTLTVTWTITAANPAVLTVNANSSLTPSASYPRIMMNVDNLTSQVVTLS